VHLRHQQIDICCYKTTYMASNKQVVINEHKQVKTAFICLFCQLFALPTTITVETDGTQQR
jgi:hypothetical protein